jgi:hypothetical protein
MLNGLRSEFLRLLDVMIYSPIDINIVKDLINALPGNSSVNTFQRATMEAMSQ